MMSTSIFVSRWRSFISGILAFLKGRVTPKPELPVFSTLPNMELNLFDTSSSFRWIVTSMSECFVPRPLWLLPNSDFFVFGRLFCSLVMSLITINLSLYEKSQLSRSCLEIAMPNVLFFQDAHPFGSMKRVILC